MYWILSVMILMAAVLLILVVLVQNSKGGGLASNFSSSNQVMGVRKTTDFLEKATWGLAIAMVVFSIGASLSIPRAQDGGNDKIKIEKQIQNEVDPAAIQNMHLAAYALGLNTLWFTLYDKKNIRKILNVPDDKNPLSIVCLGKSASETHISKRKDLDDKVKWLD